MQNYIKYDKLGVKSIHCMNCGLVIALRRHVEVEIPGLLSKKEKVMVMTKLSSFRQRAVDLDDGAYMEIMVCDECVDLDLDMNKIERAVASGWDVTLQHEGKTKTEIKKYLKAIPKIKRSKRGK